MPKPAAANAVTVTTDTVRSNARRLTALRRYTSQGVAFDFKHGQTGVAPNAIELHPILAFACLIAR
jgi:hypothetical protein